MTDHLIHPRLTARIVLLNDRQQILLFQVQDSRSVHEVYPTMTDYWITPGGGVEPNETLQQAALRELWEETGIRVDQIGPCVWYFERVLHLPHKSFRLQEHFFVVRISSAAVSTANMLDYERRMLVKNHWWPLEELSQTTESFLPPQLPALLPPLLAGDLPSEPVRLSAR